jgi:hypothetical protein
MAKNSEVIQLMNQTVNYYWEQYETIYNYLRSTSTL